MNTILSAPKLVLLAAHLASRADVDSLSFLVSRHREVLRKDLVLRILLTYLPETIPSQSYVPFLQELASGDFADYDPIDIDVTAVAALTEKEAAKQARKLRLVPLTWKNEPLDSEDDALARFLLLRAHKVDEAAGLLTQLPDLIVPFLHNVPSLQPWMISAILPLLRRNYQYYPQDFSPYTVDEFRALPDTSAVAFLLSNTGAREEDLPLIGRDMRGLIGSWLHNPDKWKQETRGEEPGQDEPLCSAFEVVLGWLTAQASNNWRLALKVIEQWDGPVDSDLGDYADSWWTGEQRSSLQRHYIRAALASAYLIPDSTSESLVGAHKIVSRAAGLLGLGPLPPPQSAEALSLPAPRYDRGDLVSAKATSYMRSGHLENSNPLTSPDENSVRLLAALITSAVILDKLGISCSIRRAGDLLLLRDAREQKSEALKFIHAVAARGPKNDDAYWVSARRDLLWLWSWEPFDSTTKLGKTGNGIFGAVDRQLLEAEFLRELLTATRYDLARTIYEEADPVLETASLRDTVVAAAMNAFDNSSNPNRTRGSLKKCDEIIHAFPRSLDKHQPAFKKIDSLLKATHALGFYRLVLKQGEPFSPVVLRVHSDPISIIGKLLEQNPGGYTKIQEFLEVGANMVRAGLYANKHRRPAGTPDEEKSLLFMSEKRVTAMCIEAALREDDFETAYSYVASRLGASTSAAPPPADLTDNWSWTAALKAGQYIRNPQTLPPTHLGTASGNPAIRHLEQRLECLSTALRIAPASQLHEILKAFSQCEGELDSAVKEEADQEAAWEVEADLHAPGVPGSFAPRHTESHNATAPSTSRQAEEAPMSLFDLSRATARVAQRNLGVLSSLSSIGQQREERDEVGGADHRHRQGQQQEDQRARKRDQFRDAAMGTLVSGVGWLVGAPTGSGSTPNN
ncbi:uncharacterized protein DNG_01881 [Cephalotrichum gorgonifer]|uniref:Sec39 domain-containing protein n=1 Tax=Cephalotrichum gorgonifer TaxID=2041049 RepID=A0AAE8MSL8_9PEZI|nr:uncharacterized protein DNG_01881 [Cephalotrichum gorgonifer]